MFYLIYKISSNFSNAFYIGRKTVKNLNQFNNYWSSSKKWKQFVLENGKENFTKEILFEFDNELEQVKKENYFNLHCYKNDPDCWSRGTFTGMVSESTRERVAEGTHNFLSGEIQKKSNRKRVADRSHHLLSGEIQSKTAIKRFKDGTHHFLKNKGSIWVCNSEGPTHIKPEQLEENISRGYQKGKKFIFSVNNIPVQVMN